MRTEPIEPSSEELERFTRLLKEANEVGLSAAQNSAQRLKKCVEVGKMLISWKQTIPKGHWQTWLNDHMPPEFNERTRRRWMDLATKDANGKLDLETARGLRHAYQLAQLFPEGDTTGAKTTPKQAPYIVHLNRLVSSLKVLRLETLNPDDRQTLKDRLQPLIHLHSSL